MSDSAVTPPRPAARRWLNALSLGIIATYAAFLFVFFDRSGPRDGDQFLVFHSLQYWNASLFGIAKQWTPVMCAGMSMAGEPQIPFMSLSMVLTYAFGPLLGVRLATVVYLLVGWVGAYFYAGLWLRVNAPRALAAALFVGNGFFFCRLGFGHFDFMPFLILPLMLWALHRGIEWRSQAEPIANAARIVLLVMMMGAAISLAIDGSPVAIIHLLLWIGLYALVLGVTERTPSPTVIFAGSLCMAGVLDAGYLWPMFQSQATFPRLTPDTFTSALSLLWFALLPVRGKVLPANGNGHELSVFVGPVVAFCLWRYRHWLIIKLPNAMRRPLFVVSLASIVLGMGSLKALHVPSLLSAFDVLRPLPGFRSIGVTGRYWGFLALPLSLLGAAALWKYAAESPPGWRLHAFLGAALVVQLGFQINTLVTPWLHSPHYLSLMPRHYFQRGLEDIEYVAVQDDRLQGELIAPTRGVSNCYDMDDFTRVDIGSGKPLIERVMQDGRPAAETAPTLHAGFSTWSHIRLAVDGTTEKASTRLAAQPFQMQVALRQAYHPLWRAPGCTTSAGAHDNMIVDCPAAQLAEGAIELNFDDTLSDLAARTSEAAWTIWFPLIGLLAAFASFTVQASSASGRRL
jgi:hypothetical protein